MYQVTEKLTGKKTWQNREHFHTNHFTNPYFSEILSSRNNELKKVQSVGFIIQLLTCLTGFLVISLSVNRNQKASCYSCNLKDCVWWEK